MGVRKRKRAEEVADASGGCSLDDLPMTQDCKGYKRRTSTIKQKSKCHEVAALNCACVRLYQVSWHAGARATSQRHEHIASLICD